MMSEATNKTHNLGNRVCEGDRRAIGQAISCFENDMHSENARLLASELWPNTGEASTIGITGPPGVGKSTLTDGLITQFREEGKSVGILAVDPSSSASKGALLGDRIRMGGHYLDPDVFIRSMSSRGHLGGTSEASFLAMSVLDAAGKDVILVETVGVGQSELEIQSLVETVVVMLQPDSGDSIQLMKSGLMEVPDILCLNKKDQPGAMKTAQDLRSIISLQTNGENLFVETDALTGEGLKNLVNKIASHRSSLGEEGLRQRRKSILSKQLASAAISSLTKLPVQRLMHYDTENILQELEEKSVDILEAARLLIKELD